MNTPKYMLILAADVIIFHCTVETRDLLAAKNEKLLGLILWGPWMIFIAIHLSFQSRDMCGDLEGKTTDQHSGSHRNSSVETWQKQSNFKNQIAKSNKLNVTVYHLLPDWQTAENNVFLPSKGVFFLECDITWELWIVVETFHTKLEMWELEENPRITGVHPLGNRNVCTKFHGNPTTKWWTN